MGAGKLSFRISSNSYLTILQCAGSTIMLRCAWSPDGQYIVSAHSLNNGGPTAQVIEREGWACDKDYVGHRKAVTAVRFIPNLVKRKCGLGNHQKVRM